MPCTESRTIDVWREAAYSAWDGSAISLSVLGADGYFSFQVPAASAGVAVGLTETPADSGYFDLSHGLIFQSGFVRVVESGAMRTAPLAFADTDTWYLARSLGAVYVLRDDGNGPYSTEIDGHTISADLLWTSAVGSDVAVVLRAALVAGGDRVEAAALVEWASPDLVVAARARLVARILGDGVTDFAQVGGSLARPLGGASEDVAQQPMRLARPVARILGDGVTDFAQVGGSLARPLGGGADAEVVRAATAMWLGGPVTGFLPNDTVAASYRVRARIIGDAVDRVLCRVRSFGACTSGNVLYAYGSLALPALFISSVQTGGATDAAPPAGIQVRGSVPRAWVGMLAPTAEVSAAAELPRALVLSRAPAARVDVACGTPGKSSASAAPLAAVGVSTRVPKSAVTSVPAMGAVDVLPKLPQAITLARAPGVLLAVRGLVPIAVAAALGAGAAVGAAALPGLSAAATRAQKGLVWVAGRVPAPAAEATGTAILLNAATMAVSRYSVAVLDVLEIDGALYWVTPNGLLAEDPGGPAVRASLTTGMLALGTDKRKCVPDLVANLAADGLTKVWVTAEVEGRTREIGPFDLAGRAGCAPVPRRLKLGRGVKLDTMALRIESVGGTCWRLLGLAFVVEALR